MFYQKGFKIKRLLQKDFISPSLKVIDNLKEIVNLTEDIKSQWQDLDR